jgi:hypothetical protein
LRTAREERRYEGRVPQPRQWLAPDRPHLLTAPASTDGVHVLAEMALSLVTREGIFFLERRKWYEESALDLIRLGPGPLSFILEPFE